MDFDKNRIEHMNYNKFTLSFPKEKEILYRKNYFKDSLLHLRIALLLLATIYGLFGFLDFQIFPDYANIFLKIRFLVVIPFISVVLLFSFTKIFQKYWQALLIISFIVGGTGISAMTMFEPENYSYYAGLMLVFSAGYFFIKLRFFYATIAGWITLIIFNILAIFIIQAPLIVIISNNFFFISANVIGMVASYNIEFQKRNNFHLNQKLDDEKLLIEKLNKNLEKKVTERTQELTLAKEITEAINSNITAIIEGTTNSIWAFDNDYNILYINHVFQQEFYNSFNVLLTQGSNLVKGLPKKLRPIWKPRYDRVLNSEQFSIEDIVDSPNGKIYIHIDFNPIIKNGKVIGGSCFGSNITERKIIEEELLNAKENAEKSDKLKSAFLANMSHEIRTPMNGILGFSSLLQEPHLSGEKQQKYLEIIEKSGNRMLNIINDIIDISKIESGLMQVSIKKVNINEQLEYIYSFFKHEAKNKGLQLTLLKTLPDEDVIIKSDPDKLSAILSNLVKNAIKYTSKGSIEFGYRKKENNIEFFVKDTGIGIPNDKQSVIFERFIQADIADKMARQGAGLGLSISKAFIKMLNGEIWVESDENKGSTFYFTLPYSKNISKKTTANNIVKSTNIKNLNLKILIAEDDEASSSLLSILVEEIGSEIITAFDGVQAVEICKKNPDIDLILMDIQMPNLDGLSATKQIRLFNKNVIIIAQTAYGLSGDEGKTIEAGCNDYISKPIDKDNLFALITKYFKK
jgi:signal transduction histidine kinase